MTAATATEVPTIDVTKRERLGSRDATRLRAGGRLPAVIYGHKKDPVHVSMDRKQFLELLQSQAHVLEVVAGTTRESCLVKQIQWNHLGSQIVHADLARVDLTERVTVSVELHLTGEAVGLKETGAILEHPLSQLEIECLAGSIPGSISVDIGDLGIGDSMTVADVPLPEGVVAITDADSVIASIRILAEQPEDAEVAPEAAEGEPQIIGRKEQDAEEPKKED